MFKYSIIIPVYNAEKFLKKSVESITAQTYENYEIVLVNDGSTDGSYSLCESLKNEFPQKIVVIDSPNMGTSAARNLGISKATGDYIGFMDNDDFWLFNTFLSELDGCLSESKADCIFYRCSLLNDATGNLIKPQNKIKRKDILDLTYCDAANLLLKNSVISSAVWIKFTKREVVFSDRELLFPVGMRNEDTDWTAKLLGKISSLDYYDKPVYAYRKGNEYSQTSKAIKKSHIYDLMKIIAENIDGLKDFPKDKREVVLRFLSYPYLVMLGQVSIFECKKEFIPFLKKYKFLLLYSKYGYMKILYLFIKVFGIRFGIFVSGIGLKIKYPNITHD